MYTAVAFSNVPEYVTVALATEAGALQLTEEKNEKQWN